MCIVMTRLVILWIISAFTWFNYCFRQGWLTGNKGIDQSQNATLSYPTMHNSEQKWTHFWSEWCIVGMGRVFCGILISLMNLIKVWLQCQWSSPEGSRQKAHYTNTYEKHNNASSVFLIFIKHMIVHAYLLNNPCFPLKWGPKSMW